MLVRKCSGDQSGLKYDARTSAVHLQLVLVRVDEVGVGVLVQMGDHFEQRVGRDLVVVIEKRDELALGQRQRGIRRRGDAGVRRQRVNPDPRIVLRLAQHLARFRSRRSIVRQAQLPVRVRLTLHRLDAGAKPSRVGVVDGRHDAHQRPIRERFGLRPHARPGALAVGVCCDKPHLIQRWVRSTLTAGREASGRRRAAVPRSSVPLNVCRSRRVISANGRGHSSRGSPQIAHGSCRRRQSTRVVNVTSICRGSSIAKIEDELAPAAIVARPLRIEAQRSVVRRTSRRSAR